MSILRGLLDYGDDADRVFASTLGQEVIHAAIVQAVGRHNEDLAQIEPLFIEKDTEGFKFRYQLPGFGRMQQVGTQAPPGAVKRGGYWEVAYPLYSFAEAFGGNRIDVAHMTLADLDSQFDTIQNIDEYERRWQLLHALFDNVNGAFTDPRHGSLTIRRLANSDGSVYPPVIGGNTEADDNHYLISGYTVATISTTNMPLITMRNELVEHFGGLDTGGSPILVITTATIADKLRSICTAASTWFDFKDVWTDPGDNTDLMLSRGVPNAPGYCVGRAYGVWVFAWEWMPSTYAIAIHMGAAPPLVRRVDPAATGLAKNLHLVVEDENYPLRNSYYQNRYGLGCGNRLSACVMEIADDSEYEIPSDYD